MKIPIYEEIKGMINCSLFQQWNIIMLLKRSHRDKVHIAKNLKTFHLIKRSEMLTTVIYHLFIWTAQYGYNLIEIPREYTTQYGYILTAIPRKEGHRNGDNSWWGPYFPGGLESTVVISTYLIMYSTNHWVHPLNGMLPGEYTRTQYMIRNLLKL